MTPQQQQLQVINSPVLGAKTAAQSDPKRRVSMQGDYIGPDNGVFVNQNEYHVAPIGTPLATAGVNTCSVLIVIDRQNQRHYLAHIDSSSTPGQIAKTVQDNFPSLNGLEVYLMEGMQPSGTSQNIYSALQQLGLEKRLQFISFQGTGFPQVGTQNETIFNPAITFSKKSNQRVAK